MSLNGDAMMAEQPSAEVGKTTDVGGGTHHGTASMYYDMYLVVQHST